MKNDAPTLDELRESWVILSADGGSRWYVGRDIRRSGCLEPAYCYGLRSTQQGDQIKIRREVAPVLMLGSSALMEVHATNRIPCSSMTDPELHELLELIGHAEKQKQELRAARVGILSAS